MPRGKCRPACLAAERNQIFISLRRAAVPSLKRKIRDNGGFNFLVSNVAAVTTTVPKPHRLRLVTYEIYQQDEDVGLLLFLIVGDLTQIVYG